MDEAPHFVFAEWFWETPACTRWWTAATFITSALVQCGVFSPFQLFFSYRAVFQKHQYWRLLSSFVYFGPLSLDLIFNVYFLQRYARLLEESSGRSPARFAWMIFCAMIGLIALAPFVSMPFLGHPLSSTLVYIWSRRNPESQLGFLGVLVFSAPFLPWVLMLFSLVVHGRVPKDEILGVIIGHALYFFNDLYPAMHNNERPLDPPSWWVRMFDGAPANEATGGMDAVDNIAHGRRAGPVDIADLGVI